MVGVCGIATGGMFRRLVSRALAAAWAPVFAQATRPYQFALRTRAGVDALSPRLRATLGNDARATVVSLNGRFCVRLHLPCRVSAETVRCSARSPTVCTPKTRFFTKPARRPPVGRKSRMRGRRLTGTASASRAYRQAEGCEQSAAPRRRTRPLRASSQLEQGVGHVATAGL